MDHRKFLNGLIDRLETYPVGTDPLTLVKAFVAGALEFPGVTETQRISILTNMENGGYEALVDTFMARKLPAGFDPTDRPWNRN